MNNITSYRLLCAHCGILSDSLRYQTTGNFEKLLLQEGTENTTKIATPVLLAIKMHIRSTRLSENNAANAEYDSEEKLLRKLKGFD